MKSLAITCVLLLMLIPCVARPDMADTWVGGVDLPNRYLFIVAHFSLAEPGSETGTLFFADGEVATLQFESSSPAKLRFILSAGQATYVFDGTIVDAELSGVMFPQDSEDTRFPFKMSSMRRVETPALRELEGTYGFEDGRSLMIRAVSPGFLRAYDAGAGSFDNLYPESARRFFGGPGLDRPFPRETLVEFSDGRLRHSTWGRGVRVDVQPPELRWTDDGSRATIELPDGHAVSLLWVEPGTFEMGDPLNAAAADSVFGFPGGTIAATEYPMRETKLTKGFWLGITEVTNAQFRAFVDAEAYITGAELEGSGLLWIDGDFERVPGASWRNPGREIRPDEPVVMLSWHDASAFCRWLSRRTGREVGLPTEAEWEYACRAGASGFYAFGNDPEVLDEHAWFGSNAGGKPHPVATLEANAWGFHEMHGNVWEWCSDWYEPLERSESAVDPSGPESGEERVLRGGSWINGAFDCRAGYRAHDDPDLAEPHFGFRVRAR